MRIAVIGGNGQTGNYLLPMVVREGHEVVSVCRGKTTMETVKEHLSALGML